MAARRKRYVTPKVKTKYKVRSWPAYEAALRKRGDVTVWFDQLPDAWNAPSSGLPGGQRRYSDLAIVTVLTPLTVLHLALRQAEGFVGSLIRLMGLDLDTPDHTALSQRGGSLHVPRIARWHQGPIHLVVDSTGLKILGDGEWHAHKHRTTDKRRRWQKLHLGVDAQGFIVVSALTDSQEHDATVGIRMISEFDGAVGRFTADGAYDTRAVYEALARPAGEPRVSIVIPPRKTAKPSRPPEDLLEQRDAAIRRIAEAGRWRWRWRKGSGAHRQARGENAMFRYKRIVGDRLRAKTSEAQATEARIAVSVVNRIFGLGIPDSESVGSWQPCDKGRVRRQAEPCNDAARHLSSRRRSEGCSARPLPSCRASHRAPRLGAGCGGVPRLLLMG